MGKKKEEAAPAAAPKPSGGGGGGYNPNAEQQAGYSEFAKTGGFSQSDLGNIRARALSPVRAVYANAQRNVNRQRSLQGGYSPGFGAMQTKMAREQGQETSDAAVNAESGISEMVQKGKLAGLAGLQGSGGGGGGGGGSAEEAIPEKKKGFWGKLGGGLKKVAGVALPIALNYVSGGGFGALSKIGKAAGGKM
jgi:hypothetical protein